MGFPYDFISEDKMTELPNSASKAFLAQRVTGFGSSKPTLTKAINGTAPKTNTGGDLPGRQPLIANVGVAIGGNVIDLELLKGGADMPKPAQGSFTVAGDLIVNATIRDGMEVIHRNITQDRNPKAEYADGGAFPSAHTVVASSSLNAAKTAHTIVDIPEAIKHEVDPKVTISSNPAIADGKLEGIVEITGIDRNGVEIVRVARWNKTNIATLAEQRVDGYFKTITKVTSQDFKAGNVVVTAEDKATKITFTPYDSAIVDYVDLQVDIGNLVPFAFYAGAINGVGLNFTKDEAIQYTLGMLFGKVGIRKNLIGGTDPTTLPSDVKYPSPEVYVGTQAELEVAGTVVPLETLALNMSQSYVAAPYIGKTIWPKKPRRSGYRSMNLALEFPATVQNDWFQYFQAHATIAPVVVRMRSGVEGTNGQFGGSIEWEFSQVALSEAPTIDISGQDVAGQTATLVPFSPDANAAFKITSVQDDYEEKLYRYA